MSKRAFVFIDGSNFYFKYVCIPKSQSYGLSNVADDVRLLRSAEIEQFLSKLVGEQKSKKKIKKW